MTAKGWGFQVWRPLTPPPNEKHRGTYWLRRRPIHHVVVPATERSLCGYAVAAWERVDMTILAAIESADMCRNCHRIFEGIKSMKNHRLHRFHNTLAIALTNKSGHPDAPLVYLNPDSAREIIAAMTRLLADIKDRPFVESEFETVEIPSHWIAGAVTD